MTRLLRVEALKLALIMQIGRIRQLFHLLQGTDSDRKRGPLSLNRLSDALRVMILQGLKNLQGLRSPCDVLKARSQPGLMKSFSSQIVKRSLLGLEKLCDDLVTVSLLGLMSLRVDPITKK